MNAGLIATRMLQGLQPVAYSASGAVSVQPHRAELDSSGGALTMTLAAPGSNMVGRIIVVILTEASNPSTLQYTGPGGSVTETLTNVGDALYLIGATANDWAPLISPFLLGLNASAKGAAITQAYSSADRTHAARTAAGLTDNSGGTAGATLAAITGGGAGCENATKDAIASLNAELAKVRADQVDTAQLLNSLVDDLQTLGLIG